MAVARPTLRLQRSSIPFLNPRHLNSRKRASPKATATRAVRTPRSMRWKMRSAPWKVRRRLCALRTGMAAITTLFLSTVKSGDHVIVSDVVYGGTMRLFREVLNGLGIANSSVDRLILKPWNGRSRPRRKLFSSRRRAIPP